MNNSSRYHLLHRSGDCLAWHNLGEFNYTEGVVNAIRRTAGSCGGHYNKPCGRQDFQVYRGTKVLIAEPEDYGGTIFVRLP